MDTSFFATIYQEVLRAWPNRWVGVTVALVLASAAALVVIAMPDLYASSVRVYVNSDVVLKPLLRDLTVEEDGDSKLASLRLFQTTLLNDAAINRLISTPGVGFDTSSADARSAAASIIRSGVTITEEQENLFVIKSVDTNPVRARNVVHGLLSNFIETYIHRARADLEAAGAFLEKQIEEYKEKLLAAEAELNAHRMANAEVLGGGEPNYQTRLAAARSAVQEARLQKQLAVQTRDKIRADMQRAGASGKVSPAALASDLTLPALIDRIGALQAQLNRLLLQYTEKHPDVIATRREIAALSEQLGLDASVASAAQPLTVLPGQVPPGSAVSEAAQAATPAPGGSGPMAIAVSNPPTAPGKPPLTPAQMRLLQADLAVLDSDRKLTAAEAALRLLDQYSAKAPEAEATLDKLTRDHALLKENYDQLVRRREAARMSQAAILPSGSEYYRLLDLPTIPSDPDGPDRRTLLLFAALICTALGAALAYALGLVRGTFVSAAEAERMLGLPVIARLSNSGGVLGRISQSAEVLTLLGIIAGMFVAAFVISAAADMLGPVRTEINRLFEAGVGVIGRML
jgi:uncharacterized protein involved in exopolysaccharide biosynthesis